MNGTTKSRTALLAMALNLMLILAACAPSASAPVETTNSQPSQTATASSSETAPTTAATTRTVTHAAGETDIPLEPKRVVALGQYMTHILTLDLADLSVGASPVVLDNPIVKSIGGDLSHVSDIGNPVNLEAIAALEPDLILSDEYYEAYGAPLESLQKIAPTVVVSWADQDMNGHLEQIADLLNHAEKATEWEESFAAKEAEVRERISTQIDLDETLTVLWVMAKNEIKVMNTSNTGYVFYESLGMKPPQNVQDDFWNVTDQTASGNVSQELLPEYAGDRIVLVVYKDGEGSVDFANQLTESPIWRNLPAVKANKVHVLNYDEWAPFNPLALEYQLDHVEDVLLP